MDTNRHEHHYFFISPIHQKFSEFEGRLRKWRIFNRGPTHRSTSSEPKKEVRVKKVRPACLTTPIPRKNFTMNAPLALGGQPRRRFAGLDTAQPRSGPSQAEVNARYETIKQSSGVLFIGGTSHSDVKIDALQIVCDLGSGTCGQVTKRKYESRVMAVKEMKRTDNQEESKRIFMDLDVIRKSNDCEYIVRCYGFIITMDHLYICMELMATCLDKLLNERRKGFPEEIIGKITLSVVKALDYLKETHSLMHRDVKPSNILLDWNGNVKLCDFGISGQLIDSKASTMSTGCTAYLAPERINREQYDVRSDVWSLGISLYQMATGRSPYPTETMSPFELMIEIKEKPSPSLDPETSGFSVEFCNFVNMCLVKPIDHRPKYKALLETPFLLEAEQSDVNVAQWYTAPEEYFENCAGRRDTLSSS